MPAHHHVSPRPHILELLSMADRGQSHVQFVTPRGVRDTDFADLWSRSSRVAHAIRTTLPDGRVAGVLTPSGDMIACLVGSLRAGRDFVSLPLPARGQDGSAYMQQIQTIIEASGATTLLVEAAYSGVLQAHATVLPCPLVICESLLDGSTKIRSDGEPGELIQFSSGTTGTPKGVRLSSTAIAASVEATLDALGIGGTPETFGGWVPLSHDMGLIGGLLGSWVGCTRTRPGYKYICLSPELFSTRPAVWMETCATHGVTITAAPTFAYQIASRDLLRSPALHLTQLRAAIVGAEPIGPETLQAFASAGSRHGLRETALCPAYGLAEATLVVSLVPPGDGWKARTVSVDRQINSCVSCGRILDCVTVAAPDSGSEAGPIKIAGPAVCHGHIPPRAATKDEWLDTGDIGILADGELFVAGRSDDLVCVAGRNLFAWELEREASTLPDVRTGNCAVVADGRGRYVVLFETPSHGQASTPKDVFAQVRKRLSAFAGISPSGVGCLPRGSLPKTPSGKMRRNRIAAELGQFIDSCISYTEF
jgi:acyl-CoA synthetase (AMP-forming)/AMP-acid ligase II